MTPEDRALLRSLLADERLLCLALVVDEAPVAALLPFVASRDFGAVYVQASRLARHGRGLVPGARFSAVIHRPDAPDADALQVPRVIVEGSVDTLTSAGTELEDATRLFRGRFPSAALTLALPDLTLHRLTIAEGRLIAGFGRAVNLSVQHLQGLAGD